MGIELYCRGQYGGVPRELEGMIRDTYISTLTNGTVAIYEAPMPASIPAAQAWTTAGYSSQLLASFPNVTLSASAFDVAFLGAPINASAVKTGVATWGAYFQSGDNTQSMISECGNPGSGLVFIVDDVNTVIATNVQLQDVRIKVVLTP